ncbi:unnamed protein product [Parajaminaea phylloscopi]
MKVLCVAEKPSIAKSLAEILNSDGFQSRPGKDKFCRNFDLKYNLGSLGWVDMTITSVRGHLTELDFTQSYRPWSGHDPLVLLDAPVSVKVSKDAEQIAQNLRLEARHSHTLIIWTDCDREGEHIGAEVIKECKKANARLNVKRARFSAIIASQIHAACRNAGELDWRAAAAVEARQELDLRVGAALTRLQTLGIKRSLPEIDSLISYGPCQFPTLGFVVDQFERVKNFVPEQFWYISVTDKRREAPGKALQTVDFRWQRVHLFDQSTVATLHDNCTAAAEANVTQVLTKPTKKFKPYPLTTVELQKSGSRLLRMTPKKILDVAEKLYNRGFLSYPRTETDQYDKDFNFDTLLQKQTSDGHWGGFAQTLVDGQFERPRAGKKNDKAHPPIHPTAHANNLSGDEAKVYEYVTRRFLASCSKDATGKQTTVEIEYGGEMFTASGLVIHERNYLDVFHYDKWTGNILPPYTLGESFQPRSCVMKDGSTSAPNYLTEADLVSLMDKNGIGTDATIAEHIAKVIDRGYVLSQKQGKTTYLLPSELGQGLVEGYNAIDFEKSLSKPLLRRETEYRMNLICEGRRTKEETIEESIAEYRAVYMQAREHMRSLVQSVSHRLRVGQDSAPSGPSARNSTAAVRPGSRPHLQVSVDDGPNDDGDDPDGGQPPISRPGPSAIRRTQSATATRASHSDNAPSLPRRQVLGQLDSNAEDTPTCRCNESAVARTVVKEGPNKGRKFWSCSKGQSEGSCGFFDWIVDGSTGTPAVDRRNATSANTYERPPLINLSRSSTSRPAQMASRSSAEPPVRPQRRNLGRVIDEVIELDDESIENLPRPVASVSTTARRPRAAASRSGPGSASAHASRPGEFNDSADVIDELLNTASQPEAGQDRAATDGDDAEEERIRAYRAWFASLADEDGPPSRGGMTGSNSSTRGEPAARGKPRCDCNLEAALRTVSKEGPNKGRQFHCCPKESNAVRCRMFEWLDDEGLGGSAGDDDGRSVHATSSRWTAASISDRIGSGTRGARAGGDATSTSSALGGPCFKCGNDGHWSRDCPNPGGEGRANAPATTTSSTSSMLARSRTTARTADADVCFKCGEAGHWASDCPFDGPQEAAATSRSGRGSASTSSASRRRTNTSNKSASSAAAGKRRRGAASGATTSKRRKS